MRVVVVVDAVAVAVAVVKIAMDHWQRADDSLEVEHWVHDQFQERRFPVDSNRWVVAVGVPDLANEAA